MSEKPTKEEGDDQEEEVIEEVVEEVIEEEIEEEIIEEVEEEVLEDPEPEEEPAEDELVEEPAEEEHVEDHLKDAVAGSLRLKRMLAESGDSAPAAKRPKVDRTAEDAVVRQLLTKWRVVSDSGCKHVLDQLTLKELNALASSGYAPELNHHKKTPAELLAGHMAQLAEKTMVNGRGLDIISSFKFRWNIGLKEEQQLRQLCHKDLQYVIKKYDKSIPLEDVITEASCEEPDEEDPASACQQAPGLKTIGRFNRLELIDPLADCAVFGDANLTFSLNLASHRKILGHVGRVIATTFEEIETLRERYKEIDESIAVLEEHHAEVYHGVDCTRIALDQRFKGLQAGLGAAYYNFPHSGAIQGFFDSHPLVNWRHENLMRLFFRALRSFVKPGGVVKVSSNAGAVGVRFSYIVGGAIENEFRHVETMPFLEWHLHRYGRSYGDRRDVNRRLDATNNQSYANQNQNSDMVYCFEYAPSGKTLPPQFVRLPPTLETLNQCQDGPFKKLVGNAKTNLAKQLHTRFLTELSGTHVG